MLEEKLRRFLPSRCRPRRRAGGVPCAPGCWDRRRGRCSRRDHRGAICFGGVEQRRRSVDGAGVDVWRRGRSAASPPQSCPPARPARARFRPRGLWRRSPRRDRAARALQARSRAARRRTTASPPDIGRRLAAPRRHRALSAQGSGRAPGLRPRSRAKAASDARRAISVRRARLERVRAAALSSKHGACGLFALARRLTPAGPRDARARPRRRSSSGAAARRSDPSRALDLVVETAEAADERRDHDLRRASCAIVSLDGEAEPGLGQRGAEHAFSAGFCETRRRQAGS